MSEKDQNREAVERIYHLWDTALGAKDVDAAMALYAADATLESPLVTHLLKRESGICRGHEHLRSFIEMVFAHQPAARQRYRKGYFTDGTTLMWEYPRESPDGDQMDFVEVMEIRDGLIQRHRVYWGWFGVAMLKTNAHRV